VHVVKEKPVINMSYVPKYILKRMIPEDALKKVGNNVELKMINLITTIPISQAPGDVVDLLEVKVNGTALSRDDKQKIGIKWGDKQFTLANIRDAGDIPVNAELVFSVPYAGVKVGDEAKVEISVPQFSVTIDFARVVGAGAASAGKPAAVEKKPAEKVAAKPAAAKEEAKPAAAKPAAGKKKK
jgi:hypothetical protein